MLNFKLLFLCGIFSLCVTNASAQKQIEYESRHDVAVGIGGITNTFTTLETYPFVSQPPLADGFGLISEYSSLYGPQ